MSFHEIGRSGVPYNDIVARDIKGLVLDVMHEFNAGRTHQAGNDRQRVILFEVSFKILTGGR